MKGFGAIAMICAAMYGQAVKDPALPIPVTASTRLKLEAEIKPATVKLGEPINIKFRLTNVSSMPIGLAKHMHLTITI